MYARRNLRHVIWVCLLACGGNDVLGEQAEPVRPAGVVAPAHPMGTLSSAAIERLVHDYRHDKLLPDPSGDSLAQLRRLSPEDLKRFRGALADLTPMDVMMRNMYDAYTEVLYEHRVSLCGENGRIVCDVNGVGLRVRMLHADLVLLRYVHRCARANDRHRGQREQTPERPISNSRAPLGAAEARAKLLREVQAIGIRRRGATL